MAVIAQRITTGLPARGLLIGGTWKDRTTGPSYDHVNPSTGRVQASLCLAGKKDVDEAVNAARAAFPEWKRWAPNERRDVLLRIATALKDHAEELATLATLENGTVTNLAHFLAAQAPREWFAYCAGWCDKLEGSVVQSYPGTTISYVRPEPYGVVAIIIPWNAPLTSIGIKVAPALAAGNCVVLKPPELAPFTSIRFAELCLEAGLPPGALNVVPGGPEAGDALVRHPDVDKISFTGGISTAKKIMAAAAETLTPLLFELGGKSANIVFSDADLDRTLGHGVFAPLTTISGQGCALPTRLLVERSKYDETIDRVTALAGSITVGDPFDPNVHMGPVVSEAACTRIQGMIDRAVSGRAGRLLTGGKRLGGALAEGFFIPPTVFGDVDNRSEIAQEEVFGPVLSVIPFRDEEEAVRLANDTKYGLAGYVWTKDLERAHHVAADLEAGSVSVNGGPFIAVPNAPFGGVKESGFGREGGKPGIDEFVRLKNVSIGRTR